MNRFSPMGARGFNRMALSVVLGASVLIVALVLLLNENRALTAEVSKLREQAQETERLREENRQIERLRNQVAELPRLRQENEEIHRLRNEARQLRAEKEQFASISAENQQLRASVQQLQKVETENRQLRGQTQQLQQLQAAAAQNQHAQICINNLKQLDGASQQWALENRKATSDPVLLHEVVQYLRGAALPACPAGGRYSVTNVEGVPRCTIPGHTL